MGKTKSQNPSKQYKAIENGSIDTCKFKILNKFLAALLLMFIIFLCSSMTTIFSGSIFHVCVNSRNFITLYCNYDFPLNSITNTSNISVFNETTKTHKNSTLPSPNTPLVAPIYSKNETNQLSEGIIEEGPSFIDLSLLKGLDKEMVENILNARKDVEQQIAVLRSYIAKSNLSNCENRGIYVYDLPPKFNKGLLAMCDKVNETGFCKYLTNDGMGETIRGLGKGWYNTHQFMLEPIFHNRILNHPCRVHKMREAKLFYVPFYGGLDALRWDFKKVSNEVKDSLSNELVKLLDKKWTWKRNMGVDHVFVLGQISWDFRRGSGSYGTRFLELDPMQNPIKLLIERQPWQINDVGVPYPTYFHPRSDNDIIMWQKKFIGVKRKYLISFAGAPRNDSRSIRATLITQCTSSPKQCKFFNCLGKACAKSAQVVKLFMKSEFCLQPPGDSPTRKSVFDSLITGCIPVIFDPFTAYYQYPWHLPKDYKKYSVFIDKGGVKKSEVNVVEELVKIPLSRRKKMRSYIIDELMPKLVYAQADAKLENFEDAFTISVNNLFQMAASRLP